MKNELFRKVALERLSSPEQLDALNQVASTRGWLTLLGLGLLLAMGIVWGIFGSISTKVSGQCILVKKDGLSDVTTSATGRITDISVSVGDQVVRGQTIARVEQPDLLERVRNAEVRLRDMEAQELQARNFGTQRERMNSDALAQQRQQLESQLAAANQKAVLLKERVLTQEKLLEQGLVTRQTLIGTQLELSSNLLEAENIRNQAKRLALNDVEYKRQVDNEVLSARNRLNDIKYGLESMLKEVKQSTQIASPYTGRVLELKVDEGQLVSRGMSILTIEPSDKDTKELVAYIYLPAAEGKKVHVELAAEITPSTVKREEFGFMPAIVRQVADYPSTPQGLMRIFGNEALVRQLAGDAPPIQLIAELKPTKDTGSGYRWSTKKGPPFAIHSGTLCSANIAVEQRRPIELVIPILNRTLGLS